MHSTWGAAQRGSGSSIIGPKAQSRFRDICSPCMGRCICINKSRAGLQRDNGSSIIGLKAHPSLLAALSRSLDPSPLPYPARSPDPPLLLPPTRSLDPSLLPPPLHSTDPPQLPPPVLSLNSSLLPLLSRPLSIHRCRLNRHWHPTTAITSITYLLWYG